MQLITSFLRAQIQNDAQMFAQYSDYRTGWMTRKPRFDPQQGDMHTGCGGHLATVQRVPGVIPPGEIYQGVRLNKYLLLVPKLRIRGALPPPSLISPCGCAEAQGEIGLYLYFWIYKFPQNKGRCSSFSANHPTVPVETVL